MKNAHIHIRKKFEANPKFMIVIVKDIVKDMATDIKALNITIEYFLLSLISINHSTKNFLKRNIKLFHFNKFLIYLKT